MGWGIAVEPEDPDAASRQLGCSGTAHRAEASDEDVVDAVVFHAVFELVYPSDSSVREARARRPGESGAGDFVFPPDSCQAPSSCPPSTASVCPVIQRACADARNKATSAISSGVPIRPNGIFASTWL